MPQVQRATGEVTDSAESSLEGDIFHNRYGDFCLGPALFLGPALLKKCIAEPETEKDITSPSTSISSFCTYLLRYNEVPPVSVYSVGYSVPERFEGDRNFLQLEIETAPLEFDWLSFCGNLFPETREYTEEERKAYLNFISSFFETIEI